MNDAPTGASNTVTTLEDTDYIFQLADFGYSDALDGNNGDAGSNAGANNPALSSVEGFSAVTISSLPLAGVLTHNGVFAMAGQSISVADIAAGLLRFTPTANANGVSLLRGIGCRVDKTLPM